MTIVNAAGRAMTDVTDDSQLCDVTDDQKPPGTRSYLTVGLQIPTLHRFVGIRAPLNWWKEHQTESPASSRAGVLISLTAKRLPNY